MNGDSVLSALSLKICSVCFSIYIVRPRFTRIGVDCDCTQIVSPRTGLEVISQGHSTVQYSIVVVGLCICDFKYGGLWIDSGLSVGDLV